MGRPAKGSIVEPKNPGESWALRIPYKGERPYVTLGPEEDGWDRAKVEEERDYIMARVKRGIWKPPQPVPIEKPKAEQTFLEFSNEWWELNEHEWSERTKKDYKWALELHVLAVVRGVAADRHHEGGGRQVQGRQAQGGQAGPSPDQQVHQEAQPDSRRRRGIRPHSHERRPREETKGQGA
jgi:hypothetical protein